MPEVPLTEKLGLVQEVALVDEYVRVADWPEVMGAEGAVRVAVGAGVGMLTVTVALAGSEVPPAPEQVME